LKLVSACLCGINCKYNGGNNLNQYFLGLMAEGELIPVCPEQLGGLPTPRAVCELAGGTGLDVIEGHAVVYTLDGIDVTMGLLKGAQETLSIAINSSIEEAILQSRSPSCGNGTIYDGTFSRKLITGDGVTSALLKQHGIKVWNEQEYLRKKGVCTGIESS
jgi:uncharacterized protein YbbK (DUF523 family)